MSFDDVKGYLEELKSNPDLLDSDFSILDSTIFDIILAEKKYSYGLEKTTVTARQAEIEHIITQSIEALKNENEKN